MSVKTGKGFSAGFFLVGMLLYAGCASVPSGLAVETDQPHVVSTLPGSGEFQVSRFIRIEIRFSHVMDSDQLPGFEMFGGGMTIEGQLRWVDPMTLIFRPDEPLKAGVSYQCVLREGKSKSGEALAGVPYIWVFTAGD